MTASYNTKRLSGSAGKAEAIALLQAGECVALPTETVYGLAADATNPSATALTFAAKQRPLDHPLIVHLPGVEQAQAWASDLPDSLFVLATTFWPGPLTLLLHKLPQVGDHITAGQPSVALRVPAHPDFLEILTTLGRGLTAPSANPYKRLSPTTADHVLSAMSGRIAAVFDGGPCHLGLESTILDLRQPRPSILRAGPISAQQISAVLGTDVATPREHNQVVPGNVKAHYQPRAHTLSMSYAEWLTQENAVGSETAFLLWSSVMQEAVQTRFPQAQLIKLSDEPLAYGKQFYASLHYLDHLGCQRILVETPPTGEGWEAVQDRLQRACYR